MAVVRQKRAEVEAKNNFHQGSESEAAMESSEMAPAPGGHPPEERPEKRQKLSPEELSDKVEAYLQSHQKEAGSDFRFRMQGYQWPGRWSSWKGRQGRR